ncbi:hypothetical protein U2071_15720, partial [Listeria monocytogenes]|uniref:hypothetical protein n=1 Tax=Listeria monocytogenes TaxID=1639 RepID=UPI002FDBBB3B
GIGFRWFLGCRFRVNASNWKKLANKHNTETGGQPTWKISVSLLKRARLQNYEQNKQLPK